VPSFDVSEERVYPERVDGSALGAAAPGRVAAVTWACLASTLLRIRRGEGALLAVNLSLIAAEASSLSLALAQIVISTLTIVLMYAFNDFYDAPTDWHNPKKDRGLIATYLDHRHACGVAIVVLSLATSALAFPALGWGAGLATTGVMLVNVAYSVFLKGVPVADVVWCGLWGALYAAIVTSSPSLLLLVALMTAVCHLYQAIGDRAPDAANRIITTAVRSSALSTAVLLALSLSLVAVLHALLGGLSALSAFVPFALLFVVAPHTGWLLSKVYFGAVWSYLLVVAHALQ